MENDDLDSVTTNLKFSLYLNMFFIGGGFMKIGILIPIFYFLDSMFLDLSVVQHL